MEETKEKSHQMCVPLFSPGNKDSLNCIICNEAIRKTDAYRNLTASGFDKFSKDAKDWSELNIDVQDKAHIFTTVLEKISGITEANGAVHNSCRLKFGTKITSYSLRYGKVSKEIESEENSLTLDPPQDQHNRHLRSKVSYDKRICFICYETKNTDGLKYNEGGLGRCSEGRAETRILEQKECYLLEKAEPYYQASCRLDAILKVDACDVFSADIYITTKIVILPMHIPTLLLKPKTKTEKKSWSSSLS